MFTKRIQTVKTYDFKTGEYKYSQEDKKRLTGDLLKKAGALTAGSFLISRAPMALAASNEPQVIAVNAIGDTVKQQVLTAFDPLVDLMMAISLPIASVMITGAALMILIGQKDRGYSLMMNASVGYVLVMLSPLFIKLLAGVGAAL
jgi:hypothetical protein